jgi:predicted chitinase
MKITDDMLRQIMPNTPKAKRTLYLPFINEAMLEHGITTELRAAAFLAQLAHESMELKYMEEIASGSAYEGRKDLGNTQSGDGKRFKGRGPIQLTGRANYDKYGRLLNLNLVGNPEIAATPEVGFRIAALYWDLNGLNELADKRQFKAITKRINGGYNGLDDRVNHYTRALRVIPDDFNMDGSELPVDDESTDIHTREETDEIDKGLSTKAGAPGKTEGVPPPAAAVKVEPATPSLTSKITALSMPAGAATVIGGLFTFVKTIPPMGWAIIGVCFVLLTIVGAWLYNESMKRAAARTAQVITAAADPNKNNIRIVSGPEYREF